MTSTHSASASFALYKYALEAAATGKHIYRVDFTKPNSAMSELHAGADPTTALELLVLESLTAANKAAIGRAADYLLCCCVPADAAKMREMVSRYDSTALSLDLFDIKNPVFLSMRFWFDELHEASAEFCDRIVKACKNEDTAALRYWIERGISPLLAIPHFVDNLNSLLFLINECTTLPDLKTLSEMDFRSSKFGLHKTDKRFKEALTSLIARRAVLDMLAKASISPPQAKRRQHL